MFKAGPGLYSLAAGLIVLVTTMSFPERARTPLREWVFDLQLSASAALRPVRTVPATVLVDIDRASLAERGPWPWRRDAIAGLISAALDAGASVVAVDILLSGADRRSPAALARQLAAETGQADYRELAGRLHDDDKVLAATLRDRPVVLGWVLDPQGNDIPVQVPILRRGEPAFRALWREAGATGPDATFMAQAAGSGTISLPGDSDGVVRRVPIFVSARGEILPGLAIEALRVSSDASGYFLSAAPLRLQIAERSVSVPPDGLLRLIPATSDPAIRTQSAAALLAGRADTSAFKGAIVILGSSAPELGALRPSLFDPLTPSMLLQAKALHQLDAQRVPVMVAGAGVIEVMAALAGVMAAVGLARLLRPLVATAIMSALILALLVLAVGLACADRLMDPTLPIAAATAGFLASSLGAYSQARRRETRLRARFSQHLAPAIVDRIVAEPDRLKLTGERRLITALFTDIEGFTAVTARTEPETLIATLDGYFEGVAAIILQHGGMIDKYVGDAVHAFFNMPLALDGHSDRAVRCAQDIVRWTETYRQSHLAARLAWGRTRIGIETGEAVVGEVGHATKLDYTAHGTVVNTAARLEALNKIYGTAICIGPVAASLCRQVRLTPLAAADIRGIGALQVFTPEH